MAESLPRPVVNDDGLFTRRSALAEGWSDNDLQRSTDIYRVIHGVYALRSVTLTHRLKCRAVAMCCPPNAIITGRSAATLREVDLARAHDRVELIVSGDSYVNRRFGTRCWSVRTWPDEHTPWNGIRIATPERAAFDLLARNPVKLAVANVDAMLHAGLVRLEELERFLAGRHDHGIVKARKALRLLDGRAESPPESTLRLTLEFAGLRPEPQLNVYDDFGFVARVDLGYRDMKIAVEYDGAWHRNPDQVERDEQRRARLRASGWIVIVVTAHDLRDDPQAVVERVRKAIAERTCV